LIGPIFELSFCAVVAELAQKHLSEFGIEDVRTEFGGIECIVKLKHCEVKFWWYKADIGSSIKPVSIEKSVRYASKIVIEEGLPMVGLLGSVPLGATSREVEQQMLLIVQDYRNILDGNFGDWPDDAHA
jgi:hypothetical protein